MPPAPAYPASVESLPAAVEASPAPIEPLSSVEPTPAPVEPILATVEPNPAPLATSVPPVTAVPIVQPYAPELLPRAKRGLLPPNQHKYAIALVRQLKKHREATPFLNPVDPIALKIPQYPDFIKSPMDLTTIEKRLTAKEYDSTEEFTEDVRLIFANCYRFNGREAVVSKMAANVETFFEKLLLKMPTPPPPPPEVSHCFATLFIVSNVVGRPNRSS